MTIEDLLKERGAHIELGDRQLFWRDDFGEWRVMEGQICISLYRGTNLGDAIDAFIKEKK